MEDTRQNDNRLLGTGLVLTSVLVMLAMGHHPSAAHGIGGINTVVHVGMMILLSVQFVFLSIFTLGLSRRGILAAFAIFALGLSALAHIVAALFSGFITPTLSAPHMPSASHDVLKLAVAVNQTFAKFGIFATGFGFVALGSTLVARPGIWARLLGASALVAGLAPAVLLLASQGVLDVHGALAAYGLHMAWLSFLGLLMLLDKDVHGAD